MELRDRKKIVSLRANLDKYENGTTGSYGLPGYDKKYTFSSVQPAQGVSPVGITNTDPTNNTNLPKVKTSSSTSNTYKPIQLSESAVEAIGKGIPQVINLGSGIYNAHQYDKGVSELDYEAGSSSGNYNGIGYNRHNLADYSKEMGAVKDQNDSNTLGLVASGAGTGATIGSLAGPVGSAIGGVIGGIAGLAGGLLGGNSRSAKARKAIQEQQAFAQAYNNHSFSNAVTQYMQLDNLQKEGDYGNQILYAANGKQPVYSIFGPTNAKATAKVSSGELIGNFEDGYVYRVPGQKNNKDTKYANLKPTDFVISNKYGLSDYAALTGNYEDALIKQKDIMGYKNGRLPRFAEGILGNLIPSGLGMILSAQQIADAKRQDINSPVIYAENLYERSALNDLAGLRINEYPILNRFNQQRAEADFDIDNSGGLGGGQRARVRAANLATTQRNIADALVNIQNQNNQYRSQLATAKMNLGAQRAQRQQASNQYRSEMTARGHAMKQQGIQTGISNLLAQLQGFYANEFKRNQFNETMDLYRQQQQLDRDKFEADQKNLAKINAPGNPYPKLYTPSMTYNAPRVKSNLAPTSLWNNTYNNEYSLRGSQPYDTYTTWLLKRRGILR